jgi:hypothetical protein
MDVPKSRKMDQYAWHNAKPYNWTNESLTRSGSLSSIASNESVRRVSLCPPKPAGVCWEFATSPTAMSESNSTNKFEEDEKTYIPKKTNHPSAAPASKGYAYNGENSGDEETPEKGARITELVAKLQKSGLNIEQIVNAKHAARQMRRQRGPTRVAGVPHPELNHNGNANTHGWDAVIEIIRRHQAGHGIGRLNMGDFVAHLANDIPSNEYPSDTDSEQTTVSDGSTSEITELLARQDKLETDLADEWSDKLAEECDAVEAQIQSLRAKPKAIAWKDATTPTAMSESDSNESDFGNHCRRRLTGLAARFERHLRQ